MFAFRARRRRTTLVVGLVIASLGAAPAAPTYVAVEQRMKSLEQRWQKPEAQAYRHASGWTAFFDAIRSDLRKYTEASSENDRLVALNGLYRKAGSLRAVAWPPAQQIDQELRSWMRPRVRLAWAERQLEDRVRALSPTTDPARQANRTGWVHFVEDDLAPALRQYEGAQTVGQHQVALRAIYERLNKLHGRNGTVAWPPALALETAVNELYNRPNLDLSVDVNALSPALNQPMVQEGWIYFKNQWSYVTPGPKTGFGLLPSDEGIAFYNSQMSSSVTPISNFNQQVASNPQGQRAAKLYQFGATSSDNSEITVRALLTPNGLSLSPGYAHSVGAVVSSQPTQGHGLGRAVASLVGFNQRKITQKVWEGAYPQIQQGVVEGAAELGGIKTSEAEAQQNARLRQYLVGNDTLVFKNLAITGLTLRSRPEFALVGGTMLWRGAGLQVGADAPQPAQFETLQPGVAADVHLPSIMTNLTRGYLQSDRAKDIQNLMIVTRKVPPGTPPSQGVVTSQNVDFATFRKAVETAVAANDPKVMALRVKKPGEAPEFGVDSRGYLVATVHDFALEVPAPEQARALAGADARILMLAAPKAEFVISFKVEPAQGQLPIRLSGRIEEFDPGPGARVFAVGEDEKQPRALNNFASMLVMRGFGGKLRGQPINVPLSTIPLRGYSLASVSPLDPSGWMRLVLTPGSAPQPVAPVATAATPVAPTVRVAGQP